MMTLPSWSAVAEMQESVLPFLLVFAALGGMLAAWGVPALRPRDALVFGLTMDLAVRLAYLAGGSGFEVGRALAIALAVIVAAWAIHYVRLLHAHRATVRWLDGAADRWHDRQPQPQPQPQPQRDRRQVQGEDDDEEEGAEGAGR